MSERQRTRSSSWGEKEFQLLGEKGRKKVEKERREEERKEMERIEAELREDMRREEENRRMDEEMRRVVRGQASVGDEASGLVTNSILFCFLFVKNN